MAQGTRNGAAAVLIGMALAMVWTSLAKAFPQYEGCALCHGDFRGPESPSGTIFPSDSKHEMHRAGSEMATACALCHSAGGFSNPFTGSSEGTATNPGVGCTGCHGHDYGGDIGNSGAGLRARHTLAGVDICAGCHADDPEPLPEDVKPTYYGTVDTRADDPCNAAPDFKENWSIGDTRGLDNDGDGSYDEADSDCAALIPECDPPSASECPDADVNCDDIADGFDIAVVRQSVNWLQDTADADEPRADVNRDGLVDGFDIATIRSSTCWLR